MITNSTRDLETVLNCQIATASDLALLRNAVSRPKESVAEYDHLSRPYDTPLCAKLRSEFGDLEALSKIFSFAREATAQLGEWCADELWRFALAEKESEKVERKMERLFLGDQGNRPMGLLDSELVRLRKAKDIVQQWTFRPPTVKGNDISPKVLLLLRYLALTFEKPTDTKCIIFVKRRSTARLLRSLLNHLGTLYLRPETLTGSGDGAVGDVRMSFREQILTLLKFRKGEVNCLIATSIAEEGIDIPDCNLILRFDLYDTVIQYIQSRGRARHANSKYLHLAEKGNAMHRQAIEDVRRTEQMMRQFCESLPADRLLQGDESNLETILVEEKAHRKHIIPETGAVLTYSSSLVVLAHFVACLVSLP